MSKFFRIIIIWLCVFSKLWADKKNSNSLKKELRYSADQIDLMSKEHVIVGKGHVKLSYKGIHVQSDEMTIDFEKKSLSVPQTIVLSKGDRLLYGRDFFYKFGKKEVSLKDPCIKFKPSMIFSADSLHGVLNEKVYLKNACFSNCSYKNPHWCLRSKRVYMYHKKKACGQACLSQYFWNSSFLCSILLVLF